MTDIKKYPWESTAQLKKDPLYAVKSLAKHGHYMVGGTMLREGQWRLNVRGYEVKKNSLLEDHTNCLCMTMDDYKKLMTEKIPEKAAPIKKPEPKPEEVVTPEVKTEEVPAPELEPEPPKRKKKKKKKSEDS